MFPWQDLETGPGDSIWPGVMNHQIYEALGQGGLYLKQREPDCLAVASVLVTLS